jgi:hypothetical protein
MPTEAQRDGIVIGLPVLNLGARKLWVVNATPACFTPGRIPVSVVHKAAWAPGSFWTGVKKRKSLVPIRVQTPAVQPVVRCYTDHVKRGQTFGLSDLL